MRVVHVYKAFTEANAGGVARSIAALAAGMRGHPVDHCLYTLSPDGPWARDQSEINLSVQAGRRTGVVFSTDFSMSARRGFASLVQHADLVHYHLPWPFVHILDTVVPRSTPRVATYHADITRNPVLSSLYEPLMRRFLRRLDAVIATSTVTRETSESLQSLPPHKVHVAELGLDIDEREVDAEGQASPLTDRVGEGFMLFVGVTRYYKGVQYAIEALRYADTRLVIAGEAPNQSALMRIARDAGVADRVIFLGRVSEADKWALLKRCRALVLPSILRAEGFGLVLVEAAAAARPSITCELGTGTSQVVVDDHTGLVVAPADPMALAQAMQRLADDPALAQRYGKAGRARYQQYFTARRYAERVKTIYDRVLGVPAAASDASLHPEEAAL